MRMTLMLQTSRIESLAFRRLALSRSLRFRTSPVSAFHEDDSPAYQARHRAYS